MHVVRTHRSIREQWRLEITGADGKNTKLHDRALGFLVVA